MFRLIPYILLAVMAGPLAQAIEAQKMSGNPVFPGWYADPEGAVFGDR